MGDSVKQQLRTVDVEPDEHMLIKPGELIDIVELSPLTLQDRRIYNLLILNAWDSITEPKEHRIHKRDLRGTHHTNERVGESLLRLMGAVAQLRIERDAGEGAGLETFTRRVQLLAGTEESARSDGIVFYSFPAAVRGIIKESSQYARLQKQVMFAFSSKYALTLYEMVQKRGNLKFKTSEEFPLDRFRAMLGVDPDKLQAFKSLKQRAIDPAVLEVNGLGEFGCKVEPSAYAGRKVTAVRLSWWAKNFEEHKMALNELRFSRVGRRARLKGEVVTVASAGLGLTPPQDVAVDGPAPGPFAPPHPRMLPSAATIWQGGQRFGRPHPNLLPSGGSRGEGGQQRSASHPKTLPPAGSSGLTEREMERFRRDFQGLDVSWLEREFREWVAEREAPHDYAAAFYGFMKRKKAEMA
jgi:Initiator Replication protein